MWTKKDKCEIKIKHSTVYIPWVEELGGAFFRKQFPFICLYCL